MGRTFIWGPILRDLVKMRAENDVSAPLTRHFRREWHGTILKP